MAELSPDARIRDLERRLDMDPASRLFVSLAEEYRKLGRFKQALSALQKGLLAYPGYVAAQVALGRVYTEVGQSTDAIATFTKVLVVDPGNLVASKSLADIYLGRGDKLEAVKKYKLYRALSGDRKVDPMILALEAEVTPRPVTPTRSVPKVPEPPPPPPKFQETDKSKRRPSVRLPAQAPAEMSDAFDITSVAFEPGEDSGSSKAEDPFPFMHSRDTALGGTEAGSAARPPVEQPAPPPPQPPQASAALPQPAPAAPRFDEATTTVMDSPTAPLVLFVPTSPEPPLAPPPPVPLAESAGESTVSVSASASPAARAGETAPRPLFQPPDDATFGEIPALFQDAEEPAAEEVSTQSSGTPQASSAPPTGRALADLYYSQGHYAEALQIYDDLVTRHPFDEDLMKMRREAEARLLPAGSAPAAGGADAGVERRRARIRVLERWLSRVQAG